MQTVPWSGLEPRILVLQGRIVNQQATMYSNMYTIVETAIGGSNREHSAGLTLQDIYFSCSPALPFSPVHSLQCPMVNQPENHSLATSLTLIPPVSIVFLLFFYCFSSVNSSFIYCTRCMYPVIHSLAMLNSLPLVIGSQHLTQRIIITFSYKICSKQSLQHIYIRES